MSIRLTDEAEEKKLTLLCKIMGHKPVDLQEVEGYNPPHGGRVYHLVDRGAKYCLRCRREVEP